MNKARDYKELMGKIGYQFKNEDYLIQALTHRSYLNEGNKAKRINNEKLEFLGDAVVNLITTEYLYTNGENKKEGELAKLKSKIVSEPVFSKIASDLELGEYLFLSNGEVSSGGRTRKSILGDAFEALIGAIFKDSDYYNTKKIVMKYLEEKIKTLEEIEGIGDYKTILQEIIQSKYREMPEYNLVRAMGPDHDKVFEISVSIKGEIKGIGIGKSKKEAEKNAAKKALEGIKNGK